MHVNLYIKLIQINTLIFDVSNNLFRDTPFSLKTFQHTSKLNPNTLVQAHQNKNFLITFPIILFFKSSKKCLILRYTIYYILLSEMI